MVLCGPQLADAGVTLQTTQGDKDFNGQNSQWAGTITASRDPSGAFMQIQGLWTDPSNGQAPDTWQNFAPAAVTTQTSATTGNWATGTVNTQIGTIKVAGRVWAAAGNGTFEWKYSNITTID